MSTLTGSTGRPWSDGARGRVNDALRRGWYWGVDYGWVARGFVGGLVRRDTPARYAEGTLSPVLLLPGVVEEWTLMRSVADRLSRDGHPVHVLPELRRNTMTVSEGSALAAAYLAARDLRDVVVVAHSKGGLIGKHVLIGDADARVRAVVAIATPFAGSVLARWFPWRIVRALRPADATIVALSAITDVNHRITSIYPAFDPHIPAGSHLDGATNVRVAAIGHFRILDDPEVLDAVAEAARAASGHADARPDGKAE